MFDFKGLVALAALGLFRTKTSNNSSKSVFNQMFFPPSFTPQNNSLHLFGHMQHELVTGAIKQNAVIVTLM